MAYKFSPSTKQMYALSLYAPETLPADCVDVTVEERAALAMEMRTGKVFGADSLGRPIAVPPPPPTPAWALATLQKQAKALLLQTDKTCTRCAENGILVPDDLRTFREVLREVMRAETWSVELHIPEMPPLPAGI